MEKQKAIFNWSGGKDSSLALYKTLQGGSYEVAYLVTSVSEKYQRISQHGVRVELLKEQAESIGIPLRQLVMPDWPSMETYNQMMKEALAGFKEEGTCHAIFGDIFLEDLRRYREERLSRAGFTGVFPIWKVPTDQLASEFIQAGFKAVIVCVDEKHLDKSFVGRDFNQAFLHDLPDGIDPCGEYGEFHSFVYDGPLFRRPIPFARGEVVYRRYTPPPRPDNWEGYTCGTGEVHATGFWYCDLLPEALPASA